MVIKEGTMSIDLLKSHINAYTKKDGSVVQAHDDKRVKKAPVPPSGKASSNVDPDGADWKAAVKYHGGHESAAWSIGWGDANYDVKSGGNPDGEPATPVPSHLQHHYDAGYKAAHEKATKYGDADSGSGDAFDDHMASGGGSKPAVAAPAGAGGEVVERLSNTSGHMKDQYGKDWGKCGGLLIDAGLSEKQAKWVLQSKNMRWAADAGGGASIDSFRKYFDANKSQIINDAKGSAPEAASAAAPTANDKPAAAATPHLGAHAKDLRAEGDKRAKAGGSLAETDKDAFHSLADSAEAGDHKRAAATLRNMDTEPRDVALSHIHPDHWDKMGFDPIDKKLALKDYDKLHGAKAPAKKAAASGNGAAAIDPKDHAVKAGAKNASGVMSFSDPGHAHDFAAKTTKSSVVMTHPDHKHHMVVGLADGARMEKNGYKVHRPGDLQKSVADTPLDLLKAHVNAYTRKDGVVVQGHNRQNRRLAFMVMHPGTKTHRFYDWESGDEIKDHQGAAVSHEKGETTYFHTALEPNGERSFTVISKDEAMKHTGRGDPEPKKKAPAAALPPAIHKLVSALTPVSADQWTHKTANGDSVSSYPVRTGGSNHVNSMDTMGEQGWRVHNGPLGPFDMNGDADTMVHQDGHVARFHNGELRIHHASKHVKSEAALVRKLWEKAGAKS